MKYRCVVSVCAALLVASPFLYAQPSSRSSDPAHEPLVQTVPATELTALLGAGDGAGGPGIVRIDETAFQAGSGLLTFSEFPLGSSNPVYAPGDYGGGATSPSVSFGGFFVGQMLGDATSCPPGAALTGCVIGSADGPLVLDPAAPATSIVNDGANPTSPVLSGSPTFNGPIAILFDTDQAGVGLEGGYFDDIGGVAITAFARDGSILGSVVNEQAGIEFLGLVTADGSDRIAGLLFSLVGAESAGFAIDNVRFGSGDQIEPPNPGGPLPGYQPVPAIGSHALILMALLMGLLGFVAIRR